MNAAESGGKCIVDLMRELGYKMNVSLKGAGFERKVVNNSQQGVAIILSIQYSFKMKSTIFTGNKTLLSK